MIENLDWAGVIILSLFIYVVFVCLFDLLRINLVFQHMLACSLNMLAYVEKLDLESNKDKKVIY